jgi:alpha-glucosidase
MREIAEQLWWRRAVVYQIYPRSFADSNGDGIGDLRGVIDHLDHMVALGVDAMWLSPIYPSPMADFGYDVSDYCDIDPVFGDLATFDELVEACHQRGLRVLLDWVGNHTSSEHPWFVESRSSRNNPKRDWYLWRDPKPDGSPPNNWLGTIPRGDVPWTYDERTGQSYLHQFLPGQPDLNWANPDVRAAMADTLRFWLDRGVDGFRADVVNLIGKDISLADDPGVPDLPHSAHSHEPVVHEHLREIRSVLDEYSGDRMMVGEIFAFATGQLVPYVATGDELHLSFNFKTWNKPWSADRWRALIDDVEQNFVDAWPTWVLSNHDNPRHRTRFGTDARARAAAVLLLTLRGTPFIYAGEELGLGDATISEVQRVDPGGRDGCRAPLPWTASAPHGWTAGSWLPFVDNASDCAVESQAAQPDSMLALYRRLLRLRQSSPALTAGSLTLLDSPHGTLAWRRAHGDDRMVVAVNFTSDPVNISLGGQVLVATDARGEGQLFSGRLAPDMAVILLDPSPDQSMTQSFRR